MDLFPDPKSYPAKRLFCLDALRGLDMLLLTVVGPIFWALNGIFHFSPAVTGQFRHGWVGFSLWDIIMPLFIFMCGAAIPFALPKRLENGRAGKAFWGHVFARVILLWFCGMLAQGNLCSLDPLKIKVFSNTLQSIAVGYLGAACVLLIPSRRVRLAIPVILLAAYGLMIHFGGDYTPQGNFTVRFDRALYACLLPAANDVFAYLADPKATTIYTWVLPSLMFVFMTLAGMQATEILKSARTPPFKARALAAYGAGLLALGWILSVWVPVIKPIYTVSFTCQAMGWCVLALDLLYVVTDVFNLRRGWGIVLLYGQFALTAYMFRQTPLRAGLSAVGDAISQGFWHVFGKTAQPVSAAVVTVVVLTTLLVIRRRVKART